jgi:hypothetical protein
MKTIGFWLVIRGISSPLSQLLALAAAAQMIRQKTQISKAYIGVSSKWITAGYVSMKQY